MAKPETSTAAGAIAQGLLSTGLSEEAQTERARHWQDLVLSSAGCTESPSSRATLLLVDDEEILRSALERSLSFQGFRVLCAVDGTDAETVFREHATEIDAVLLDVNMPRQDGEATFHELRKLRPSLPIVLMSGFSEDESPRLQAAGLSGFLPKPFRMSELRRVLRVALGRDV